MNNRNIKYWLERASNEGFAIPAFNFNDCWDLMAIVAAAEAERAPIMVSSVGYVVEYLGLDNCAALGHAAMNRASVPVFLHLDHQLSVDVCKQAVDLGYPSVMIDASTKPLEENIQAIREVVDYAHPKGVIVEGELGRIRGKDMEGTYLGKDFLVDPDEAATLAQVTGVDMLAIGIGTQHGFYQGEPEINMQRLSEVDAIVDIPLVLHGGTGISEKDIREAISRGINKVNVGTVIRYTYMAQMEKSIHEMGPATPPGKIVQPVLKEIEAVVRSWIQVCMADGKASV